MAKFRPGRYRHPVADIALRDIWFGRVWRANACRIIEEHDDLVVVWTPSGSEARLPVGPDGTVLRIPQPEWRLAEDASRREALALIRPGVAHSLWLFFKDDALECWYVNFEEPMRRSAPGFDYADWKLDLIVEPDGRHRWKDEDELERAAALGLLDAAAVWAEAERVLADPPWPTGWEDWRPEPGWPPPRLPAGWDQQ
jgi:Protein of unknown function (DUF402)